MGKRTPTRSTKNVHGTRSFANVAYVKFEVNIRIAGLFALNREQRKFMQELVREEARAREFEIAVQWLCDAVWPVGVKAAENL